MFRKFSFLVVFLLTLELSLPDFDQWIILSLAKIWCAFALNLNVPFSNTVFLIIMVMKRSAHKAPKLKVRGSIPGLGSWQVTQRMAWSLYKRGVLPACMPGAAGDLGGGGGWNAPHTSGTQECRWARQATNWPLLTKSYRTQDHRRTTDRKGN